MLSGILHEGLYQSLVSNLARMERWEEARRLFFHVKAL